MRPDQFDSLEDLSERICDVFVTESDPDNWTGAGANLAGMDKETRGDRLWDKKNAVQTGSLLARVLDIIERGNGVPGRAPISDDDADDQIARYEKKAKELIRGIQAGSPAKS